MKKTRSNAKWAALTAKQTELLEQWLFEEKLSYSEALERARKEFKYVGSKSGLQRFYHRLRQERWLKKFAEMGSDAAELAGVKVNAGAMLASGLKMLAVHFFEEMRDGIEEFKDVPLMARILLQNEANQIQGEENRIREQGLELRRRALDFQEKRWQFDLVEEALKRLPELQELKEAREDEKDPDAAAKRAKAISQALFGKRPVSLAKSAEAQVALPPEQKQQGDEEGHQPEDPPPLPGKPPQSPTPPAEQVPEVDYRPAEAEVMQETRKPETQSSGNGSNPNKRFLTKIERLDP